jgi:potassium channel
MTLKGLMHILFRLLKAWKSIVYLSLTYEVWAFSFRLAFSDPSVTSYVFIIDVTSDVILLLEVFIRMCEWLDIALKQNADPMLERKIIMDIVYYTIQSVFTKEIVCFAAYYVATVPISRNSKDVYMNDQIDIKITPLHWVWWLCTIPRCFVRAQRLYQIHSVASMDPKSNIHTEDGKNIALFIMLSAHCIGCLFFFMSRLRGLDNRSWVFSIEQALNVYQRFNSRQWEQYLLALFKGFSAITGIEFIAYFANNLEEQLVGIAMILVQIYISALILGSIIHFLALRDPLAQQAAEKLRDLREYVQLYQLPPELEAKLVKGLEFQHRKMVLDNVDAEIELSQSLQLKVVQSKYSSLLQRGRTKGQIFFECSERFLNEMLVDFKVLYLMAGQDIVKKGDISQELIILVDGAADILNEKGESTAMISSSSPDSFPCVGEIAFFLGIMQPSTIRARPGADLRVVSLSREHSEALFKKFPDQLEVVSANILRWHGLDLDGCPLATTQGAEEDAGRTAVREELRTSITRRREEAFANVILAIKASELDVVRRLAFGGIETMKDYDGRTLLAHAAVAGAYKVAEFLLDLRADVNDRNRWGQTPLDEALRVRQQTTVQLLMQHRGIMGSEAKTAALIEAASSGHLETSPDAEQLARIMRQSSVDPDVGDYDRRTALHLACANGYVKTAELLLNLRAGVNVIDRWQATPLADAVTGGHLAVATLLRNKGARMSSDVGTTMFFDAASKGNVVALRMLHNCDIVDLE